MLIRDFTSLFVWYWWSPKRYRTVCKWAENVFTGTLSGTWNPWIVTPKKPRRSSPHPKSWESPSGSLMNKKPNVLKVWDIPTSEIQWNLESWKMNRKNLEIWVSNVEIDTKTPLNVKENSALIVILTTFNYLVLFINVYSGPAEGQGQRGFSPPTFLEILKSYWEKGVFSPPPPPPTFWHYSALPLSK